MLVVAMAAAVTARMVGRQQIDFRRTANIMEADQAGLYARAMGDWACRILERDRRDGQIDHPGEAWAMVLPPMPVENGELAGYLEDMQGRFNINSLIRGGEADKLAVERFRRLLGHLEIDPQLATAVVDWLDVDAQPGYPLGAEDDWYLGQDPAYRAANSAMGEVSELLLVRGMSRDAYARLKPHVTALPQATSINVNTAGEMVLMSLAEGMGQDSARALIDEREREGYASVSRFLAQPALNGIEITAQGLTVASSYFMATGDIRFGRLRQRHYSLLQRDEKGVTRVIARSHGGF
jgi:general secretion pathway protein K